MSYGGSRAADSMDRRLAGATSKQHMAMPAVETAVHLAGSTVDVVSVWLDAELSEAGGLAECLTDEERRRASRFVFERDRRRFIVGRARLRHFLASRLGVQPDAVGLDYEPRGKPKLSRSFSDAALCFNVSHSEGLAIYAFSIGREVGVDVEAIRELPDADAIASRFFSAREKEAYLALDPHDRQLGFFHCWTRKEAFIKAVGDGLHFPLDAFDVSLAPGEPARILRVADAAGSACGWTLHDVDLGLEPRFAAAVVVSDRA